MSNLPKLTIKEARLHILDSILNVFNNIRQGKVRTSDGATDPIKFDGLIYLSKGRRFEVRSPLLAEVQAFDNQYHNNDGGILLHVRLISPESTLALDLPNLSTLLKGSSLKNSLDTGRYIGIVMDEGPKVNEYVLQSRRTQHVNHPGPFSAYSKQDPYPVEMNNISQHTYEVNFHKDDLNKIIAAVKKQKTITDQMSIISINRMQL